MIRFLIGVVNFVFNVYSFIILIRIIISWVGGDPYNQIVILIRSVTDPVFYWVKRVCPFPTTIGMFDFAPIIVILSLYFLRIIIIKLLNFLMI